MLNLYMPMDLYLRSMLTTSVAHPKYQNITAARQNRSSGTLSGLTPEQRAVKRMVDIGLTSLILLLALPVMAIVALAIKLDSPGPILFKQRRVGEGGKLFYVYKFRSMVVNAEALQAQVNQTDAQGNVIHKSKHDPRITRVGRIIRKLSLDEFPQFFNVLEGTMSLVGPRPEDPRYVALYTPEQRRVLAVRPGITSLASVRYRNEEQALDRPDWESFYVQRVMPEKLAIDLEYVGRASLWSDLGILARTVVALFR